MNNSFVLVGRIANIDEHSIGVMVPVGESNQCVTVKLSDHFIEMVNQYCHVNDIIGIKGHLECDSAVADKMTFLSTKTKED